MKKKFLLWTIFVLILIHFLKDITQDILQISSPLDILGDAKEDLSKFPKIIKQGYLLLGISSLFSELFLIIAIPLALLGKNNPKLEKFVWVIITFLLFYFYQQFF